MAEPSDNPADYGADSIREVHNHPKNRLDLDCPECGHDSTVCNCDFCCRGDPDVYCARCGAPMVGSGPGYR